MKKGKLIINMLIIISLVFTVSSLIFAKSEVIDPNIPESWWDAPKLASEIGINKYSQSPMLDERVKNGELPSVKNRLPNDPPVIEPYQKIGKYGGTAETWGVNIDTWDFPESQNLQLYDNPLRAVPDGSKLVPFLVKKVEHTDDYKTWTVYLREGMKWSDGEPFTSDDIMFWWEQVGLNEDINPLPPQKWKPISLLNVEKLDRYTVSFHYKDSVPHKFDFLTTPLWRTMGYPKHYLKQFHKNFRDEEKLIREAKEAGFDTWYKYFQDKQGTLTEPNESRPHLRPYIIKERTSTYILGERNPYYPFVDPDGNQLPYIDKLRLNLAQNIEMANLKAVTGEATLAASVTMAKDIPLYKKNESKGGYTTSMYTWFRGSQVAIQLNMAHENLKIRDTFLNKKFRIALSLAINRNEINEKVFHGLGTPRQNTITPWNSNFKSSYAKSYIDYDITRAKKLLDEIGMKDENKDGYREMPNGDTFNPTIVYASTGSVGTVTPVLELVKSYWEDIGLNVDLKMVSYSLWVKRKRANNWDITYWVNNELSEKKWPTVLRFMAPLHADPYGPFTAWGQWYETDGDKGIEPPEEIKELIKTAEILSSSTDENERKKASEKLLQAQAENIWTIGTVGLNPKPVIRSNNLKNFPEKGFNDSCIMWLTPYYPIQFYLEKE